MEKLEITPFDSKQNLRVNDRIVVQFNPTQYTVTKAVDWKPVKSNSSRNAPQLEFKSGRGRSMKLDLLFDVSEPIERRGRLVTIEDVRELTAPLVALTRGSLVDRKFVAPEMVVIEWGDAGPANSDFPFIGVIDNLSQNFTLFSPDGRPLRAMLSLGVTESEFGSAGKTESVLGQAGFARAIRQGNELSRTAGEIYSDPTKWRTLAEANNIDNPLKPDGGAPGGGRPLVVPKDAGT